MLKEHRARFVEILEKTQQYVSMHYAEALTDREKLMQLPSYIEKFLHDNAFSLPGLAQEELVLEIYREMAEYSCLTPYLGRDDIEEININGWDDIAITYTDGRVLKSGDCFYSPQHATDTVKKLLRNSRMIIDNAVPMAQGHLPGNTRITALKTPLVDEDRGISASIRLLHPSRITREMIVSGNTATAKMVDFLCTCLRYGVSFVVAGATSSGKTTLLNALLSSVPSGKRIYTIESGARELSLIRTENGRAVNNVVHTLSRPSENKDYDISQEDLVVASLRFSPDVVVVGEMRDIEAYSAVEASLTGHTVVSTIHSYAADAAHMRLALLCQKKFPIDFNTSLLQAAEAFPLVVYAHRLEDNSRKIMDISECEILPGGKRRYRTLYRYNILSNTIKDGNVEIKGRFEQPETISEGLRTRLLNSGIPGDVLGRLCEGGADYA